MANEQADAPSALELIDVKHASGRGPWSVKLPLVTDIPESVIVRTMIKVPPESRMRWGFSHIICICTRKTKDALSLH